MRGSQCRSSLDHRPDRIIWGRLSLFGGFYRKVRLLYTQELYRTMMFMWKTRTRWILRYRIFRNAYYILLVFWSIQKLYRSRRCQLPWVSTIWQIDVVHIQGIKKSEHCNWAQLVIHLHFCDKLWVAENMETINVQTLLLILVHALYIPLYPFMSFKTQVPS